MKKKEIQRVLNIRSKSGELCQLSLSGDLIVISFHDGKTKPLYITPEQLKYIIYEEEIK